MRQRSSRGSQAGAATRPPADPIETGLRLLSRRDHSREELRRKLERRGHDREAIDGAIRRIDEAYGLDDQAFARSYVRRRASTRGPRAIASELAARGIDRRGAEAALAGFGAAEQLSTATRLAEHLYRGLRPGMSFREVLDSIGTKLLRRGFPTPIVRAACRFVFEEASQTPED